MKEFPKELFVAIEECDGEEFFAADVDIKGLSISDDVRPVARYILAGHGEVVNESKYTELEGTTDE
jgi:hypothetical protein